MQYQQQVNDLKNELVSLDGQIAYCHLAIANSTEKWIIKEYIGVKFDALRRKKYVMGVLSRICN